MGIYAAYKNREGHWVVDGENGRAVYPGRFDKVTVVAHYQGYCHSYQCGHYNITVYEHDIKYKKGNAALVQIDRFDDEDKPLDSKSFYLSDGKKLSLELTESDVDKIYNKKEGSWL